MVDPTDGRGDSASRRPRRSTRRRISGSERKARTSGPSCSPNAATFRATMPSMSCLGRAAQHEPVGQGPGGGGVVSARGHPSSLASDPLGRERPFGRGGRRARAAYPGAVAVPAPAPKRSHFSLGGIPVRVEPAFFIIIAILGYNPYRPSVPGVLWWVAIAFVSILVHELGHAVAFRLYGVRPSITLHGMGGLTSGSGELSPDAPHRREPGRPAVGVGVARHSFVAARPVGHDHVDRGSRRGDGRGVDQHRLVAAEPAADPAARRRSGVRRGRRHGHQGQVDEAARVRIDRCGGRAGRVRLYSAVWSSAP